MHVFPSCSVLRYRFSAEGPPGNAIPPGDLNAENDRADGRASFLRAPDTVAPPVALEPDNSPFSGPRFSWKRAGNRSAKFAESRGRGPLVSAPRRFVHAPPRAYPDAAHRRGEASD